MTAALVAVAVIAVIAVAPEGDATESHLDQQKLVKEDYLILMTSLNYVTSLIL